MRWTAAVLAIGALATSGPAQAGEVKVTAAWARATVSPHAAAVYLTLWNTGPGAERLIKAEVPIAKSAEIHTTVESGGVMQMRQLPELALPAGTTLTLAPRGTHIMLLALERPLTEGERFGMTLHFAGGSSHSFEVAVASAGAMAPPSR
jgi:periplasmic copper chaperone A